MMKKSKITILDSYNFIPFCLVKALVDQKLTFIIMAFLYDFKRADTLFYDGLKPHISNYRKIKDVDS